MFFRLILAGQGQRADSIESQGQAYDSSKRCNEGIRIIGYKKTKTCAFSMTSSFETKDGRSRFSLKLQIIKVSFETRIRDKLCRGKDIVQHFRFDFRNTHFLFPACP